MDKIQKFLFKLSVKEREVILFIVQKILSGEIQNLDQKKLKGEECLYRVRKGNIRIVYYKKENNIKIIDINYRGQIYN